MFAKSFVKLKLCKIKMLSQMAKLHLHLYKQFFNFGYKKFNC